MEGNVDIMLRMINVTRREGWMKVCYDNWMEIGMVDLRGQMLRRNGELRCKDGQLLNQFLHLAIFCGNRDFEWMNGWENELRRMDVQEGGFFGKMVV